MESVITNRGNAGWDGDLRQAVTVTESVIADSFDAGRDCNLLQALA